MQNKAFASRFGFRASRGAISRFGALCFDCKHSVTDYSAPFDAS